jgi:TRAP-type C4-dicarboxylate transport system substrate-binding protein
MRLKTPLSRTLVPLLGSFAIASMAVGADFVDQWSKGEYPGQRTPVAPAPTKEYKFSHPGAPASVISPWWERNIKVIELLTGGAQKWTIYGGAQLHAGQDGFKAVRSGISDYSLCYSNIEPPRSMPMNKVFELPLVTTTNPQAANRIFAELAPKYFRPEFEEKGVYFANKHIVGYQDLLTRKPVRSFADLKGMKIAAQGTSALIGKALGVTFVNMPFQDIVPSMQQGVVDGTLWVDAGILAWKAYEVGKYMTRINLNPLNLDMCVRKETFDAMPADQKLLFYRAQQLAPYVITQRSLLDQRANMAKLYKDNNVEIITWSEAEMSKLKEAVAPVIDNYVREFKSLPIRELLADIARLTAKYEKMKGEELFAIAVKQPVKGIIAGM